MPIIPGPTRTNEIGMDFSMSYWDRQGTAVGTAPFNTGWKTIYEWDHTTAMQASLQVSGVRLDFNYGPNGFQLTAQGPDYYAVWPSATTYYAGHPSSGTLRLSFRLKMQILVSLDEQRYESVAEETVDFSMVVGGHTITGSMSVPFGDEVVFDEHVSFGVETQLADVYYITTVDGVPDPVWFTPGQLPYVQITNQIPQMLAQASISDSSGSAYYDKSVTHGAHTVSLRGPISDTRKATSKVYRSPANYTDNGFSQWYPNSVFPVASVSGSVLVRWDAQIDARLFAIETPVSPGIGMGVYSDSAATEAAYLRLFAPGSGTVTMGGAHVFFPGGDLIVPERTSIFCLLDADELLERIGISDRLMMVHSYAGGSLSLTPPAYDLALSDLTSEGFTLSSCAEDPTEGGVRLTADPEMDGVATKEAATFWRTQSSRFWTFDGSLDPPGSARLTLDNRYWDVPLDAESRTAEIDAMLPSGMISATRAAQQSVFPLDAGGYRLHPELRHWGIDGAKSASWTVPAGSELVVGGFHAVAKGERWADGCLSEPLHPFVETDDARGSYRKCLTAVLDGKTVLDLPSGGFLTPGYTEDGVFHPSTTSPWELMASELAAYATLQGWGCVYAAPSGEMSWWAPNAYDLCGRGDTDDTLWMGFALGSTPPALPFQLKVRGFTGFAGCGRPGNTSYGTTTVIVSRVSAASAMGLSLDGETAVVPGGVVDVDPYSPDPASDATGFYRVGPPQLVVGNGYAVGPDSFTGYEAFRWRVNGSNTRLGRPWITTMGGPRTLKVVEIGGDLAAHRNFDVLPAGYSRSAITDTADCSEHCVSFDLGAERASLVYARDGLGCFLRESYSGGLSWSEESSLAITGCVQARVMSNDWGDMIVVGFVYDSGTSGSGRLWSLFRRSGETDFSAAALMLDETSAPIALADKGLGGIAPMQDGSRGWLLTVLSASGVQVDYWGGMDRGVTWTTAPP